VLELSSDAARAIERLLSDSAVPDGAGIRIESVSSTRSITGARSEGGALRMVIAAEPPSGDELVEQEGTRLFIEPHVSPFLDDKLLDITTDGVAVEFVLAEQR
jgi:Fe-S cluster assembly iron-binding protein IscA